MKWLLVVLVLAVLLLPAAWVYMEYVANPRVSKELRGEPDGERARKVMLLTLPSGRELPVNYYREDDVVYAGADGRGWKELEGESRPVEVLIRGERLRGRGRAVLDDPEYTDRIFRSLRPNAIEGFGTLIEIQLEAPEAAR